MLQPVYLVAVDAADAATCIVGESSADSVDPVVSRGLAESGATWSLASLRARRRLVRSVER